eukprot:15437712-Alexandrium_andersonii.AAC.1
MCIRDRLRVLAQGKSTAAATQSHFQCVWHCGVVSSHARHCLRKVAPGRASAVRIHTRCSVVHHVSACVRHAGCP